MSWFYLEIWLAKNSEVLVLFNSLNAKIVIM